MSIQNFFKKLMCGQTEKQPTSADLAKQRLSVVVGYTPGKHSSQNNQLNQPKVKKEVLDAVCQVLSKYFPIKKDDMAVHLGTTAKGDQTILELNLTFNQQDSKDKETI